MRTKEHRLIKFLNMKLWLTLLFVLALNFSIQAVKAEETSTRIWANYVDTVQEAVTEKWKPRGFLESYYSLASFEINQDGSLKSVKLEKTSGNKSFDAYALDSIKLAAPFAAMPASNKPIKVKYYFDYKYQTEDFILDSGAIKN